MINRDDNIHAGLEKLAALKMPTLNQIKRSYMRNIGNPASKKTIDTMKKYMGPKKTRSILNVTQRLSKKVRAK